MVKILSRPLSQQQNPNRVGPIRKPGLDLLDKDEVKAKRPSMWNIVFYNDDYTSMEFVAFLGTEPLDESVDWRIGKCLERLAKPGLWVVRVGVQFATPRMTKILMSHRVPNRVVPDESGNATRDALSDHWWNLGLIDFDLRLI